MKKWKKLLFVLLTALTVTYAFSENVCAEGFRQEVLDGVIFICWDGFWEDTDEYGNTEVVSGTITGTGFFVGEKGKEPQYIVTNHHVVEAFINCQAVLDKYGLSGISGKQSFPLHIYYEKDDYEEAYVVDYDAEKDLAILKIDKPTHKRNALPLRMSSEDMVGINVWAVGYPAVVDEVTSSVTSYGKKDATVTVGSINRIYTETGTGKKMFQTDAKVRSGNSGGPLVDADGAVLGVNTWVVRNAKDPNLNYAVSIDNLISLLDKNGIPYTMWKKKASFTGSVIFWICIAAGAAVILAAAALVIVKFKKSKSAGQEKTKKRAASKGESGKAFVRSSCAQHKGMAVALSEVPLTIGRDAAVCRIVFQDNTPGVSSRHCTLAYDAQSGNFILTDMNSTYGTFLADGRKVTPNAPYYLKAGDSFYLGEAANMMYVGMER